MKFLVFYGSYRRDRLGIRLANYLVRTLGERHHEVDLIDAQAVGLPMLDRMFKEHPPGMAPEAMVRLATAIRSADGFVFVNGEYNWSIQPGLKNLMDHFLEEWFWRPAAIAGYSSGRTSGAHAAQVLHGTLGEMGMAVVPSVLAVGGIASALNEEGQPTGDSGRALDASFSRFAADLEWWGEAISRQRAHRAPPY